MIVETAGAWSLCERVLMRRVESVKVSRVGLSEASSEPDEGKGAKQGGGSKREVEM